MENSNLPEVFVMRWNEAVESNSIPAWRSLSMFAWNEYQSIERITPKTIMAAAMYGVAVSAFDRYIELQKVTEHADAT